MMGHIRRLDAAGGPRMPNRHQGRILVVLFISLGCLLYVTSRGGRSSSNSEELNAPSHSNSQQAVVTRKLEKLKSDSCVKLNDRVCLPRMGFGTAALGARRKELISHAVKVGYRLFDTASDTGPWYKTEATVGTVFREAVLGWEGTDAEKRELKQKLMIETKMHPQDFSAEKAEQSVIKSFDHAQEAYIDVYILHYPNCGPSDYKGLCPDRDGSESGGYAAAWPILEQYHKEGKIGAIGVANFDQDQLQHLIQTSSVKPSILQTWFDPYHQPWKLVEYCRSQGIVFQSYSSLGTQWAHRPEYNKKNPILSDETLLRIATTHKKSVPQIVMRWLLQEDILVIPRSGSEAHIEQNFNVWDFELSAGEMTAIRGLHKS